MAYMTTTMCSKCGEKATVIVSNGVTPHLCPDCEYKKAKAKSTLHFDKLDKLTLEQRIRKIENWMYRFKLPIDPNIKY